MSVPKEVLDDIVGFIQKEDSLVFVSGKHQTKLAAQRDRHRGFFVRRRADLVGSEHQELLQDNAKQLKARIKHEYSQVLEVVLKLWVTLMDDKDQQDPSHLDLAHYSKVKKTTIAKVAAKTQQSYHEEREYRLYAIGFRAAAIHCELWGESSPFTVGSLDNQGLSELIDHRLRIVELLTYSLGEATALGGPWKFDFSKDQSHFGPWYDGFLVRSFERDFIPEDATPDLLKLFGGQLDMFYRFDSLGKRILYNGRHLGYLSHNWEVEVDSDFIITNSNLTPSQSLGGLFVPEANYWERPWMPAANTISALHLEAMTFSRRRRDPANEADLDNRVNANRALLALGNVFRPDSKGRLMGLGTPSNIDPFFDNTKIYSRELQIGDHLFLSNGHLLRVLSVDDAFENVIVTDVDSNHTSGDINPFSVVLQSPGGKPQKYMDYLSDVAVRLNKFLAEARDEIKRTLKADPAATTAGRALRWAPYEASDPPGAWWLWIGLDDTPWNTINDVQANIFGSVIKDPNPGPGYNHPPLAGVVWFPLFVPAAQEFAPAWTKYLDARRTDPTIEPPSLKPLVIDGKSVAMSGFIVPGPPQRIPVIRPKIIPLPDAHPLPCPT